MSRLVPLAVAVVLAGTYLAGAATRPPRWEEPRRALIAYEMIERGDYVVPRLLGEPYLNKPPLQNWLIVLAAGGAKEGIVPLAIRLPTLLALLGIAVLLWRLGLGADGGPRALPAVVFLTFGIVVQYGRAGETDVLFAFFVWAAWASFEVGRRRGATWLQWAAPQVLLAAGVLTKGIAPLFFYPPLLWLAWRRRAGTFRAAPFLAGFGALALVVAAWLVPYALRVPAGQFAARFAHEIQRRVVADGPGGYLLHLARFPRDALGATLPWSVVLGLSFVPRVRGALRGLLADPYRAACAAVVGWSFLVFLLSPGALPRYLIPALPAAAVLAAAALDRLAPAFPSRSRVVRTTATAVVLWGAALALGRPALAALPAAEAWTRLAVLFVVGAAIVAAAGGLAARGRPLLAALAALGLLHALVEAGVREPRAAARDRAEAETGALLAAAVPGDAPVACSGRIDRRVVWAFTRQLGRVPVRRAPSGPRVRLDRMGNAPPGAELLALADGYALWRVR